MAWHHRDGERGKQPRHRRNTDGCCQFCFSIYFTFISLCLFHLNSCVISLNGLISFLYYSVRFYDSLSGFYTHSLVSSVPFLCTTHVLPLALLTPFHSLSLPHTPSFYFLTIIFHYFNNKIFYLLQYPNCGGLNRNDPHRLIYFSVWPLGSVATWEGLRGMALLRKSVTEGRI